MASGCKNLLESGIGGKFIFLGRGDGEQPVDDVVLRDTIALGCKINYQSMAQDGLGECLNVVGRDVRSTMKQRAGFAPQDQELNGSRTGSPSNHLFDEIRNTGAANARLPDKRKCVTNDMV